MRRVSAGLLTLVAVLPAFCPDRAHAAQRVRRITRDAHPSATTPSCKTRNKATGTITYGDWRFPPTLNPLQSGELISADATAPLFESLFGYDERARLLQVQAAAIPTIRNGGVLNGGKTIVVHLKTGMRWSNGAEITSADVKFGWEVEMDPATGPICAGTCDVIDTIQTPNRYTAVMRLKRAYAPAVPDAVPLPWPRRWQGDWDGDPHAAALKLEEPAYDFEGSDFPTSGPYQVASFVNGDRIVYRPMKWYATLACGASVKTLIYEFFGSKASLIAAAMNRSVDITGGYSLTELTILSQHRSTFSTSVLPAFSFEHIELNVDATYDGKPNPLANTKVRLALALALDKFGLAQSSLSITRKTAQAIVAWTPFVNTPSLVQPFADRNISGQWDPLAGTYVPTGRGRALRDAKRLLAQTPWKGGFGLDFVTGPDPTRQAALSVVESNWARIGVTVNGIVRPGSALFGAWEEGGTLAHGQYQATMFFLQGAPDPDLWKFSFEHQYIDRLAIHHSLLNQNYSGVRDIVLDRSFEEAGHSFRKQVRARDYAVIQRRINTRAYLIGLYFRPVIATTDGRTRSFSNNPITGPFWNVYAWKSAKG